MLSLDIDFFSRFFLNTLSVLILCYGCYYRNSKNLTITGSFILFGTGLYIITYLLHGVDMSMGFAFGMFAVFTMLRYRTESLSISEMTYLFLVIAMSLLAAVGKVSLLELVILNSIICSIAFLMGTSLMQSKYQQQTVLYEHIENIKPENNSRLIADLRQRCGLMVEQVNIVKIDFVRDTALLKVFYLPDTVLERDEIETPLLVPGQSLAQENKQ